MNVNDNFLRTGRRDFIKQAGLATLGLVIGVDSFSKIRNLSGRNGLIDQFEINPFILIGIDNTITIVNPRNDMGQGTLHSVPAMIAEELEVSLAQITIIQSDGQSKYGAQTSGNSSSIRRLWLPLRKAGAATKEMLIKAAARRWSVSESECHARAARIFRKGSDKSFTYGELAEEASKLEIPTDPVLKNPADFNIIGKDIKRAEIPPRTTGKAVYGIDIEVPGMVYASILHSPMLFAKIVTIDDGDALKIPGVLRVMKCERKMIHRDAESVAVIATNWWAASKGRNALKVQWDNSNLSEVLDTADYFQRCHAQVKEEGINHHELGDFSRKFKVATSRLECTYETPFLSHAPIEPENTTAHVKEDGSVEIWAPIQGPGETLPDVASYLNIPVEKIKIHTILMGGSFGRKAYIDFVKEACFLSHTLKVPVKVIWTREDDIAQGPYRPGLLSHMQGFVEAGKITGFHHHIIGESILRQVFKGLADDEADPWMGGELKDNTRYEFKTSNKVSWTNVKTEIPIMWWRSVNASNLAWGQECFIDELAHLAGKDPLAARLELLEDERFIKVLKTLAEKSDYYAKTTPGTGKGIALFKAFETICACCVAVSANNGGVRIDKVVSVIDCGMYVNADTVRAQTEGNIVMGLSAAIKGGIIFKKGVCQQSNFNNYHVLRMHEMPAVEVFIMENGEAPGGVGEAGLPPVAPALGNAIFSACGVRVRNLPVDLTTLVKG
ncbi:xanthine dehydrogenase family protein molybdopterin-binding subunit [Chryseolinea soli]|uniref:Xanthine dehydrogenase family protein molybdopterin-binding subunit n=1 Tax=Chryseolinea soli TaxID=2321403 RepID=A0A385SW05_9BACT|nr:molybdopterin cofactor-binding domain-containing protein [Chryseolinea soli]AYB32978.1 xanthine dehydrogenase family protein molybdopterin-binding subunit [Chryseolinea soli]